MAAKIQDKLYFLYEGTDKRGNKVKGEVEGFNADLVKAGLRKQGVTVTKVRKKPKPLLGDGAKKVTASDIAVFSRQMSTMMNAGVPMVQSFEIVGRGHEKKSMQDLILGIKAEVEGGSSFSQALSKYPTHFDDLYVNLINAGEQSGSLEALLEKIAIYKEKTEALKAKIKKALVYPISVLVVAFVVTLILLLFVVPQFEAMFKNFGSELPALTRMVVDLSEWMQANWLFIVAAIAGGIFGIKKIYAKSLAFRELMDKVVLKAPIVSDLTNKSAIARFSRTLSTMFAAGVPMVEAMDSVAGAAGNSVYRNAILRMKEETASGEQLQAAMRRSGLFPNMVVQMIAIGEESGSIDAMLAKVADIYEDEVDNAVEALTSLMEPLIMSFLAVVIGGLVVAMYLPVFKMGDAL